MGRKFLSKAAKPRYGQKPHLLKPHLLDGVLLDRVLLDGVLLDKGFGADYNSKQASGI